MNEILKPKYALGPEKDEKISISETFHENTKLHLDLLDFIPQKDYSPIEKRTMASAYKEYTLSPKINLPSINSIDSKTISFQEVITSRRSVRTFNNQKLSIEELSTILFQTYGITGKVPIQGGGEQHFRTSPSGGALYPAEVYLGVRKVKEIAPGLYHYNVPNHELELLAEEDPTTKLTKICCGQEHVEKASVIFLISGVVARTKSKYGERGYRYVLLDIGHLGQNLYLSCTALDLAVMTTCGFYDDLANDYLGINGIDETTFYVGFVGKK